MKISFWRQPIRWLRWWAIIPSVKRKAKEINTTLRTYDGIIDKTEG